MLKFIAWRKKKPYLRKGMGSAGEEGHRNPADKKSVIRGGAKTNFATAYSLLDGSETEGSGNRRVTLPTPGRERDGRRPYLKMVFSSHRLP